MFFRKPFLDSSKSVYEYAANWTERFRHAEQSHAKTLTKLLDLDFDFKRSELICAAFSMEGRKFAQKYSDSLFTTIAKSQINKSNLSNLSSAVTIFVRKELSEAKDYYNDLLIKNCDNLSAKNFCNELSDNDRLKSILNLKNIHLVKSGAGIEEIITDYAGLKEFILKCKEKKLKTLLFALPDYEKSLELLLKAITELNLYN